MSQYDSLIQEIALAEGVDPAVLAAVVETESGGVATSIRYEPAFEQRYIIPNPRWTSLPWSTRAMASSYGLGQLMFTTAVDVGYPDRSDPRGLLDPRTNLTLTARLLRKLLRKYGGDVEDAIAAYNSGRPLSRAPKFTREHHLPRFRRILDRIRGTMTSGGTGLLVQGLLPVTLLTALGGMTILALLGRRPGGSERR